MAAARHVYYYSSVLKLTKYMKEMLGWQVNTIASRWTVIEDDESHWLNFLLGLSPLIDKTNKNSTKRDLKIGVLKINFFCIFFCCG